MSDSEDDSVSSIDSEVIEVKRPRRQRTVKTEALKSETVESEEESFMSTVEVAVKRPKKRRVDDDSEEDWKPEESPVPKKRVKKETLSGNNESPPKTQKAPKKVAVKKEPKPKVKKEPKPKVKKEPKPRVKKEPKPKQVKEPKVKAEPKARLKKEVGMVKEEQGTSLNSVKLETATIKDKFEDEDDHANDVKDLKPYNVPHPAWEPAELLSEMMDIHIALARNIIHLFENDNTIPFIARYRKELTDDMGPEKLRHAKESFELIKAIQTKAGSIMKLLEKSGKLTPFLEQCVLGAKSFHELEHIYAPYKVGGKRTKAEAARQLGLEKPALSLLNGTEYICLEPLINVEIDGLTTIYDVEAGISHIMADVISKDKDVLDTLRKLQKEAHMKIECCKSRAAKTTEKTKVKNEQKVKDENKPLNNKTNANKDDAEGKYQNYYEFSQNVNRIRPHQILAINRGENQKVLTVKLVITDWLSHRLQSFCHYRFLNTGYMYPLRKIMFEKSFKDAYTRLIQPLVIRSVRGDLNKVAETASIEVFATNLKKLLLSPPLRGKTILSLDPGFRNGCKAAVVSSNGAILEATVLHFNLFTNNVMKDFAASHLRELVMKHNCEIIGLGNGTACRETENYLSQLIFSGWFRPLDVKYTIISEAGASIYSCSPEAAKEFPNMDPNLISAVSLARRLQEPLCELVKVEPKHLGVGMYQHDVPEKQLSSTLDEVVSECVSFVGVDVNTASLSALRRVAGLNASRGSKIIEWRETNGPFRNRQQLRLVKGIGEKSYEQCAGFVRILPQTLSTFKNLKDEVDKGQSTKKSKTTVNTEINPLDQTWIHPEMYSVANRLISKCQVQLMDLGTQDFIRRVKGTVYNLGIGNLANEFGVSEEQMKLISEGLQTTPDYDFRSSFSEPLFRRGVTSMEDLKPGDLLTGRIQNVTHFGSFVDVGVGTNGLIPAVKLRNAAPQLGDRVEVRVFNVELNRKRIGLELVNIL